jgi:hypothetical protein
VTGGPNTFDRELERIARSWIPPTGRAAGTTWAVQRALVRIAQRTRSTVIAPGVRRLEQEAIVSRRTVMKALKRLEASGHIARFGRPLPGKPQPYRLLPRPHGTTPIVASETDATDEGVDRQVGAQEPPLPRSVPEDYPRRDWIEACAFRGRETALRIYQALSVGQASAPKALAEELDLHPSTVSNNLAWLSRLVTEGRPWVWREPRWHGGWHASFEATDADFVDVARQRGTLTRRSQIRRRISQERDRYNESFRLRFGVDRETGEILEAGRPALGGRPAEEMRSEVHQLNVFTPPTRTNDGRRNRAPGPPPRAPEGTPPRPAVGRSRPPSVNR